MMNFFFFTFWVYVEKPLATKTERQFILRTWNPNTNLLEESNTKRGRVILKEKNNQIKDCVVLPRMQTTLLIMLTRL